MLSRKFKAISLAICFGVSTNAMAKSGLVVNGGEGAVNPLADLSSPAATQRSQSNNYAIRFRASCFGTNLRSVSNPISPQSEITMKGNVHLDGTDYAFETKFNGAVTTKAGATGAAPTPSINITGFSGAKSIGFADNLMLVNIHSTATSSIDPVTAQITVAKNRFKISGIKFSQVVPVNGGAYRANNGPVSVGSLYMNQSPDGKTYDIEVAFPGENGFCGGYYSPLMVFLDEQKPAFNNIVDFNMNTGLKTYWPEKNHHGYFVALPEKNKIKSSEQLFGESEKYNNGFEKLATHDLNHDGVIDSKDPVYHKLVLWKDGSGKGIYHPKDSLKLSAVIKSINLRFDTAIEQVSAGAEFRERSTITLTKQYQHHKNAYIVDVWFKPTLGGEAKDLNLKLTSK